MYIAGLHEIVLDVRPIDILAEARVLGDVYKSLIVHGIVQRIEPGRRLFVINERMQQSPFIVLAWYAHRAQGMEIADTAAMDFHTHAKGFR